MDNNLVEYKKFKNDLATYLNKLSLEADDAIKQAKAPIHYSEKYHNVKEDLRYCYDKLKYYSGIKDVCLKINEWCKQKETTLEEERKMNEKLIRDQILEEYKKRELQRYYYELPSFLRTFDNRKEALNMAVKWNADLIYVHLKEDDSYVGEFRRDGLGWEYISYDIEGGK